MFKKPLGLFSKLCTPAKIYLVISLCSYICSRFSKLFVLLLVVATPPASAHRAGSSHWTGAP